MLHKHLLCAMWEQVNSLTCSEHDRRVAVVGAADDGSDDDRSVRESVFGAVVLKHHCGALLFPRNVEPFKTDLIKINIRTSYCNNLDHGVIMFTYFLSINLHRLTE